MGELTFKGLKVDELDLTNKIEGQVELDISQRASFNVKYSNDNLHCMANLTIDMMEKTHPMDFNFKISATALFDCEEGMDKKEIHKKHMMKFIHMCVHLSLHLWLIQDFHQSLFRRLRWMNLILR